MHSPLIPRLSASMTISVKRWLCIGGLILSAVAAKTSCRNPRRYHHAAVAADAPQCSQAGVEILKKCGTAVDAAAASILCLGVVNLHSTGIGGGGFMVYYNATSHSGTVVDFRETAPSRAFKGMFSSNPNKAALGPLAIAVPGQLRGLQYALQRYGRLPLSDIFAPAIRLASEGFPVSGAIERAIQSNKDILLSNNKTFAALRDLLAPGGVLLKKGDTLRRPKLAETLQNISKFGFDHFYNSTMTDDMVNEINELGGNFTKENFLGYTVLEHNVTRSEYKGFPLLSTPPPGSGAILSMILSVLEGYDFNRHNIHGQTYHYLVESFKLSYAYRVLMGDPDFNATVQSVVEFVMNKSAVAKLRENLIDPLTTFPPAHYTEGSPFHIPITTGTSHLSVLAENGDAVAVTTTINSYFGSKIRSSNYGLIFNNEMADFSVSDKTVPTYKLPPGPHNYVAPGKRPQSSTCPAVMLSKDGSRVVLVIGASGGSAITTGVAQVIVSIMSRHIGLKKSIDMPRVHHQLIPNITFHEPGLNKCILEGLRERHHIIQTFSEGGIGNIIQGIFVPSPGKILAYSDPRKGGVADGY